MTSRRADLPRSAEGALLAAIDLIYAAAADPAVWPVVIESLTRQTKSEAGALSVDNLSSRSRKILWCFNADPDVVAANEAWAPKNPFVIAAGAQIETGWVTSSEDVITNREVERTEYYNEYLRRAGCMSHIGACVFRAGDVFSLLYVARKIGAAGPSSKDVSFIRALMPHLQRAIEINRRMDGMAISRNAAHQVLDQFHHGIVFVDDRGRVLHVNRAAEETLKKSDGIHVAADGRLVAASCGAQKHLARLVGQACAAGAGSGVFAGGSISLRRPSGMRAFGVLVSPLRHVDLPFTSSPAAVVFITDPDREGDDPRSLLQELYELTPAEARVAWLLLEGRRVNDIAEELSITELTTRTHVKRILSKVDCTSQGDLIRILARGPASIRSG